MVFPSFSKHSDTEQIGTSGNTCDLLGKCPIRNPAGISTTLMVSGVSLSTPPRIEKHLFCMKLGHSCSSVCVSQPSNVLCFFMVRRRG